MWVFLFLCSFFNSTFIEHLLLAVRTLGRENYRHCSCGSWRCQLELPEETAAPPLRQLPCKTLPSLLGTCHCHHSASGTVTSFYPKCWEAQERACIPVQRLSVEQNSCLHRGGQSLFPSGLQLTRRDPPTSRAICFTQSPSI